MKTITKFVIFVIVVVSVSLLSGGCGVFGGTYGSDDQRQRTGSETTYGEPVVAGYIGSRLVNESSGLAESHCQQDVLWTHNDSGGGPFIYAIDPKGKLLGIWRVSGAQNVDWEDIASTRENGTCFLYIGDIGNNAENRETLAIYRVPEPAVLSAPRVERKQDALKTDSAEEIKFRYPEGRYNAETLMVHPVSLDIYVITKRRASAAGVYKISQGQRSRSGKRDVITAESVSKVRVPAIFGGFITGGDISPDGKRVVLCDYVSAYELTLDKKEAGFDSIWRNEPDIIETGPRMQGEAVTYSGDGTSILLTSEKIPTPLINISKK